MRLIGTDIGPSPRTAGFTRVTADVSTDRTGETRRFWFDFPGACGPISHTCGDPWAILMLPWACVIDEPVRVEAPVDRLLLENLRGLQQIWRSWYPELAIVPVEAPARAPGLPRDGAPPGSRTAAFFSGGIDSLFTLLRHGETLIGSGSSTVDDLLYVAGFNTSLDDFDAARAALAPVADAFHKTLVPIATNIRHSSQKVATPYSDTFRMIHLAHGAALGAIGHLLGGRYREVIIAATQDYSRLSPWGSHPLTDPLLGSRELRITHDGASFNRVERTLYVSASDTALASLHVCWQDRKDGNCSRCRKCMRTMATLDLLGARDRATTFDWSGYDMNRLGSVWLNDAKEIDFFLEIADEAARRGRHDISEAVARSIRMSRRKQKILALINSNPISRRSWQATRKVRAVVLRPQRV